MDKERAMLWQGCSSQSSPFLSRNTEKSSKSLPHQTLEATRFLRVLRQLPQVPAAALVEPSVTSLEHHHLKNPKN